MKIKLRMRQQQQEAPALALSKQKFTTVGGEVVKEGDVYLRSKSGYRYITRAGDNTVVHK